MNNLQDVAKDSANPPRSRAYWYSLLAGSFLLEVAGYLAFPYISLQMRARFGIGPSNIGRILMIAIWTRPLAALIGGIASSKTPPRIMFSFACLAEGICFFLLGSMHGALWAVAAILIGNIGFSIWKPNVFALAYDQETDKTSSSTTRMALLNGALNAGAASGSLLSALMIRFNASSVFLSAGILYPLLIPFFIPALSQKNGAVTQKQPPQPTISTLQSIRLTLCRWDSAALILATIGFWASYSQFNAFFSLFTTDWLHNSGWTGAGFAIVAILVTIVSIGLARLQILSTKLREVSLVSLILLAGGWKVLSSAPSISSVAFFLISIAIAEASLSIFLADSWGGCLQEHAHLMQSLNFALRSFAMGIGSLLGGWSYVAQMPGKTLSFWGNQNTALLTISFLGILLFSRRSRQQTNHGASS